MWHASANPWSRGAPADLRAGAEVLVLASGRVRGALVLRFGTGAVTGRRVRAVQARRSSSLLAIRPRLLLDRIGVPRQIRAANGERCWMSASSSHGQQLVALCAQAPVGVDIESCPHLPAGLPSWAGIFTASSKVHHGGESWTLLESLTKARGSTLLKDSRRLLDGSMRVRRGLPAESRNGFRFWLLGLQHGYVAAISIAPQRQAVRSGLRVARLQPPGPVWLGRFAELRRVTHLAPPRLLRLQAGTLNMQETMHV